MTDTPDTDATASDAATPARPLLRIVGGNPTDTDVAVLVAVLAGAGGSDDSGPPPARDLWGTPTDRLRPAWPLAPNAFPNLTFGY
ncbi:acyl-CoA carboxylase subunit epsilon [Williamsia herbipolensis]|uniref:acyl-CoA carboxylase subunit epsilon n=1 Tax=Williamsia herbipolensis TaxID=1603258 RepID=UPI0005F8203E|nr:acyl-CoA carboxylase subunit epsilon [Williamsia herbipolensis]MCX6468582.1 acyl-CoA carboxylase subunit epsilon [Mycobacteriales bacterium]